MYVPGHFALIFTALTRRAQIPEKKAENRVTQVEWEYILNAATGLTVLL